MIHRQVPRTDDLQTPSARLLRWGRPAAAALLRGYWRLELAGVEHVPRRGPVILAANHIGFMDGPLLAIMSPRPVHVMTKSEMFEGRAAGFMHAVGQLPVEREVTDVGAVRSALRVLRDGGVVGVFPESTRGAGTLETMRGGAAYLAMVTGAPIVPVAFLGTRSAGGSSGSIPPRGARIAITYGPALTVAARPWPRRTVEVAEVTELVRSAIRDTMGRAQQRTGMTLPGPLPEDGGDGPSKDTT